jgi:membrane fusion protein, multidrug efflux system
MSPQTDARQDEQQASNKSDSQSESAQDHREKAPVDPVKRRRTIVIGAVIALILVLGGIAWWIHSGTYESTDDAQVDAHLNPVSAQVQGTVSAVYVEDDQAVQAGQPLVDLDTRDLGVSLAQAQANYDQAVAQLHAEDPNMPITQTTNASDISSQRAEVLTAEASLSAAQSDYETAVAKVRQAEANNEKSKSDLARYQQLLDKREIAQSDYDQYLANARSQQAVVNAAIASADSAAKTIDQRKAQLAEQQTKLSQTATNAPRQVEIKKADLATRKASVESSKAQLKQAKLNVVYCHIVAPVSGIVMQRSAELGQRIPAGGQLLIVAQVDAPWIIANFKETQLRKMHVGQRVTVKIDALNRSFTGNVESLSAATGDRASVLPAENATGNYVKVIQRLPVRIRLDPRQDGIEKVRPGMSVEPTVHF